jgi:hypothetical protein
VTSGSFAKQEKPKQASDKERNSGLWNCARAFNALRSLGRKLTCRLQPGHSQEQDSGGEKIDGLHRKMIQKELSLSEKE